MVDKLTVDRSIGAAVPPGSAGVSANTHIRHAPGPHLQPSAGGDLPRVRLSGTLTLGKTAGIQKEALYARVDSDARHNSSPHQVLERFIDRVILDESKKSPEEARKQATALIGSCKWNDALSLMNMLRAKNIPNVINYGALMGRAKCEFDREQASTKVLEIYDDMRKDGVFPNLLVGTTVITAMGRQGRADDAEQVFREMEKRGDRADIKAFGALMSAYATKGDDQAVKAVQRLYKELIQRGHGADEHRLGTLLLTLAKADREWPPMRSML